MLKYLLILLAMIIFAGWVLYAWYKRRGVKGIATSTGQGIGILATVFGAVVLLFGKAALLFARAGAEADAESSDNPVTDHFNQTTGEVDHGPGAYMTENGSVEIRTGPYGS